MRRVGMAEIFAKHAPFGNDVKTHLRYRPLIQVKLLTPSKQERYHDLISQFRVPKTEKNT